MHWFFKKTKINCTLPFGLSSSMATIVAGGPERESLHSKEGERQRKYFIHSILPFTMLYLFVYYFCLWRYLYVYNVHTVHIKQIMVAPNWTPSKCTDITFPSVPFGQWICRIWKIQKNSKVAHLCRWCELCCKETNTHNTLGRDWKKIILCRERERERERDFYSIPQTRDSS